MPASCDLVEKKNFQNGSFQFFPLFKFIATCSLAAIAALFTVLIRYISKGLEKENGSHGLNVFTI